MSDPRRDETEAAAEMCLRCMALGALVTAGLIALLALAMVLA